MYDFKRVVAFIIPSEPVACKICENKACPSAEKAGVAAKVSGTQHQGKGEASRGKSRVELKFYKPDEYKKLTYEQKGELKK
eukprot:10569058-Ditylum_brightwellii.AAC.2